LSKVRGKKIMDLAQEAQAHQEGKGRAFSTYFLLRRRK